MNAQLPCSIEAFLQAPEIAIVAPGSDCSGLLAAAKQQIQLCAPAKLQLVSNGPIEAASLTAAIEQFCQAEQQPMPALGFYTPSAEPATAKPWAVENYIHTVLSLLAYDGRALAICHVDGEGTDRWAQRLAAKGLALAEFQQPRAFAISALGLKHSVNKLAAQAISQGGLDAEAIDQWLNEYSSADLYDTIMLSPSACFICAPTKTDSLLSASTDAELYQQLQLQGPLLLASDVLVDDRKITAAYLSAGHVPEHQRAGERINHPLNQFSHAMAELIQRGEAPPKLVNVRPVQLHIAHSWGGGLGRWVDDFIGADEHSRNLVLRPIGVRGAFGQSLALYRSGAMDAPLQQWLLADSIASTAIYHAQYARILEQIITQYGVEKIVVSSLIGQSLDVLRTALPTTVVLHDYYPYCPQLRKLFENVDGQYWSGLEPAYAQLLQQDNICLVAPSFSVKSEFVRLAGTALQDKITIIEHGLPAGHIASLQTVKAALGGVSRQDKLRIVVLGSLAPIKGLELFREALDELLTHADVYLLGCGDYGAEFQNISGVTVIASYKPNELAPTLIDIAPDFGLLMSIIPESFSYTLSELWAAGLPVLATQIGALADRISVDETGWLMPANAQSLVAHVAALKQNRGAITKAKEHVAKLADRDCQAMVADYQDLNRAVAIDSSKRYRLAKKTYNNPYAAAHQQVNDSALYIDQQSSYRKVLLDFVRYSEAKVANTPQLSKFSKRFLLQLHGLIIRYLRV